RKYFEVHARLLPRDLLNCLLAVLAEMQQQRLHELLIEQVTRAMPVAVRVARNPLPKRHGALHVGRLVLSMSKYLIRLSNTSANDHQRVRGRERKRGFGCFGNVRLEVGDEWVCQCAGKAFTGQSCRGRWFDTLTDWSSSATAFAPGHHQCYTLARTCLALRPWPADLLDAATIHHYDAASERHGRASKGAHDRALVVLHEMGEQRGHLTAPPVMPPMNRSRKRL